MKRSEKLSSIPGTVQLLQSWLWYNDNYKVFFSTRKTNNPQEYYCFFLDIKSGLRKHGYYRLTNDAVLVEFLNDVYKVKELVNMRIHNIIMIQLTNSKNELDYHNWLSTDIPKEKGEVYLLVHKQHFLP